MHKLKIFSALVLLSIMLGGCPYESTVPIDKQGTKLIPELLGTWQTKEKSEKYVVTKGSEDNSYLIKQMADDKKPVSYAAFLSMVDEDFFLNIYDPLLVGQRKFMFYKIVVDKKDKKIILSSVTENIDEIFKTSGELKAFFIKNKEHSFFFEKEEVELFKKN